MIENSIIILSYNNFLKFTGPCIDSIIRHTDLSRNEIIVVDNNSTDDSVEFLQKYKGKYNNFRLVENKVNLGFAGGNNAGIKIARGNNIILLNNDTLVSRDWLKKLTAPLVDKKVGLVGPITNSIWSLQQVALPGININNWETIAENYVHKHNGLSAQISRLCFFCVLIPKKVIEEIGYLDSGYIQGEFEDDDYCERVKKKYRVLMIEDCYIWHFGSGSFSLIPQGQRIENQINNKKRFIKKFGEWYLPFKALLDIKNLVLWYSKNGASDSIAYRSGIITGMVDLSISYQKGNQSLIGDQINSITFKERIKLLDKAIFNNKLKIVYSFYKKITNKK